MGWACWGGRSGARGGSPQLLATPRVSQLAHGGAAAPAAAPGAPAPPPAARPRHEQRHRLLLPAAAPQLPGGGPAAAHRWGAGGGGLRASHRWGTRVGTRLCLGGAAPTPISSALAAWDWLRPSAKVLGFGSNDFQINWFFHAWVLADPRQGGEGLTEMRNAWQGAGGGSSRGGSEEVCNARS